MKIELSHEIALTLIAGEGCERFTTGIGSCLREGSGRSIAARYTADRVCPACLAHAALEGPCDGA